MRNIISRYNKFLFIFFAVLIAGCDKKVDEEIVPFIVDGINNEFGRLRGFNLLGKFDASWSNPGYTEDDFRMIQELGFNFVRLPVDYRTYTAAGDWNNFTDGATLSMDSPSRYESILQMLFLPFRSMVFTYEPSLKGIGLGKLLSTSFCKKKSV